MLQSLKQPEPLSLGNSALTMEKYTEMVKTRPSESVCREARTMAGEAVSPLLGGKTGESSQGKVSFQLGRSSSKESSGKAHSCTCRGPEAPDSTGLAGSGEKPYVLVESTWGRCGVHQEGPVYSIHTCAGILRLHTAGV